MKPVGCPDCGESVPLLSRACGYCGAPNPVRRTLVVAGLALSALIAAVIAAAIVVGLTGRTPPGDATSAGGQSITGTGEDFAWLAKAMDDCDKQAQKEPNTLQFLVTPLIDEPRDDGGWRRISLNDIGNAILINGEDTIAGLKRRALRISSKPYVFSARNEDTKVVYRWNPAVGVKYLVVADGEAIEGFKVQFESSDVGRPASWGATFKRQAGNCYWVNAILRD
jgi:hypothetical protein